MPDLKIIENGLERLLEAAPELAVPATNTRSAIRASWERAGLPEKRLANAARHNIASYIMGFVAAAYDTGKVSGPFISDLGMLLGHALSIDAKPVDRHVQTSDFSPPEPWWGKEGGPWKREAGEGRELTLIHLPNMPGGHWTISIRGVPCLYGTDPAQVEERTLRLLGQIDAAAQNPAPPMRRPVQWA
ncbi:hypothetical protein GOB57_08580 [Sinorhizobium meliloti]|nr:hypothetical protein [Sinorhizobium meliloti]